MAYLRRCNRVFCRDHTPMPDDRFRTKKPLENREKTVNKSKRLNLILMVIGIICSFLWPFGLPVVFFPKAI